MNWYRLASHLKTSVLEIQEKITSIEFVEWIAYLDEDENKRSKSEYYLAQIAAEVRRSFAKNPHKVEMDDFFFKIDKTKKKEKI